MTTKPTVGLVVPAPRDPYRDALRAAANPERFLGEHFGQRDGEALDDAIVRVANEPHPVLQRFAPDASGDSRKTAVQGGPAVASGAPNPDDEPTEPEITVPMRVLVQRPVAKRTHATVDIDMGRHSLGLVWPLVERMFRDWHKLTRSERERLYVEAQGNQENGLRLIDAGRGRL